jgi:hypothetical protein
MIRLHERSVAIHDPEPVGVAVRRQPRQRFLFHHRFFQRRKIFLGRIGPRPFKQHVPVCANFGYFHPALAHDPVEPARAASVHRVADEIAARLA